MKGIDPQAQHYEEQLPSEDPGVKESEDRGAATLKRIEDMKFQAMLKGHIVRFNPRHYIDEAQSHFQWWEMPAHMDAPRLKMKDLVPLELKDKK